MPIGIGLGTAIAGAATAAGVIGGGILSSKANKSAAKTQAASASEATAAQSKATEEAMAFEREKEATRKAQYDQSVSLYQQQVNAYMANRAAVASRYGVNLGSGAPLTLGSLGGRPPLTRSVPLAAAPLGGQPPAPPATPPPMTLGGMSGWSDWRNYGAKEA